MEYGDKSNNSTTKCSNSKVTDPRWLFPQSLLALLPSGSMSNQQPQQFLMQPDGNTGAIPLHYLQAGAVPFNILSQLQQQAASQQMTVANTSESLPAPPTPGSNSLGSPQVTTENTPRSGTPATPSHTPSSLELQMQQLIQNQQPGSEQSKSELAKTLKPPKKPLTPYMRFSKTVWPQVKEQNSSLSVCEIGAAIGRMWREMADDEKGRYNDDFNADKARYETELNEYMRVTGLQLSDIVKPRGRKKKQAQAEIDHHPQPQVKFEDGELQLQKYLKLSGLQGTADPVKTTTASPRGRSKKKETGTQQMSPVQLQQLLLQQQAAQSNNGPSAYPDNQGLPNITQLFPSTEGGTQANEAAALNAYLAMLQGQAPPQQQQPQHEGAEAGWPAGWQYGRDRPQSREAERGTREKEQDVNGESNTSSQQSTSHTLYNTYAYNPWSAYPSQGPGLSKGSDGREEALERELKQVKGEMNNIMEELEKQRRENRRLQQNVENLQQQNAALSNSLNLFSQSLQQQEDRKPKLNHDE